MADKNHNRSTLLLRLLGLPVRLLAHLLGWIALGLVLLAFTPVPWKACNALGDDGSELAGPPDFIVVMGGGGIPSESGLMRTYAGAEAARRFPQARVVVCMPGDAAATNSTAGRMRDELVLRGVARPRVLFEDKGRNTREQAVNSFQLLRAAERQPAVLVVTSPEHMRRSLLSFRKAGFTRVAGAAARDANVEADLRIRNEGPARTKAPDIGRSLLLRYQFWGNLGIEGRVLHELVALSYYKLRGWI